MKIIYKIFNKKILLLLIFSIILKLSFYYTMEGREEEKNDILLPSKVIEKIDNNPIICDLCQHKLSYFKELDERFQEISQQFENINNTDNEKIKKIYRTLSSSKKRILMEFFHKLVYTLVEYDVKTDDIQKFLQKNKNNSIHNNTNRYNLTATFVNLLNNLLIVIEAKISQLKNIEKLPKNIEYSKNTKDWKEFFYNFFCNVENFFMLQIIEEINDYLNKIKKEDLWLFNNLTRKIDLLENYEIDGKKSYAQYNKGLSFRF